jgi:biopolymer transport protein ExbB
MKLSRAVLATAILIIGMFICYDAIAAPPANAQTSGKETMFSLIKKGGPVMIPLGIGSIIALALFVERMISLKRDTVMPVGFLENINQIWKKNRSQKEVVSFCEETGGPAGKIFKAGILRHHKGEEAVEKAIEDAGYREADKMKRSLRGLSIIASISPLLGLLGTVYGMILAFQTAHSVGAGKADVLAKGIYEALVTTAAGLTIAIPVLLAYQFLNYKVDALVDDLDEMGIDFMTSISDEK